MKRCSKCGVEKQLKDFYRDKTKKDGHQALCKECRKERTRKNNIYVAKKGHHRTLEQRERMSLAHLGYEPWNKGSGGCKRGHDPSLYIRLPSGVYVCLGCTRENGAKYREKNRNRIRINNRVKRYGITIEQLKNFWNAQEGTCAICGEMLDKKKYRIDHNHTSGKVRGLLCSSCNAAIGLLKDSPEVISNAVRYLKNAGD